ncbi:MAG: RNA polymerase sigma factor [Ilumatobacteraceae bacterium]
MTDPGTLVGATTDDQRIIAGLRAGNEAVFAEMVDKYHGSLVRVAMRYIPSRAVAEEVVQDTWIGVIEGIDRFEGRSSVKTWLYRILIYRARARGERERRTIPMSALANDDSAPAVPTERFRGSDALWAGHWATPPQRWDGDAEERLLAGEARAIIGAVIADLPPAQRDVIVMRDLSHFSAPEVCDLLDVTEANQRVLLHRARSHVRAALEQYLDA